SEPLRPIRKRERRRFRLVNERPDRRRVLDRPRHHEAFAHEAERPRLAPRRRPRDVESQPGKAEQVAVLATRPRDDEARAKPPEARVRVDLEKKLPLGEPE